MLPILLWLVALLAPDPAPLLADLSSPKFAVRQRAQAELQARMAWPLAVRLSLRPPANAEARRRVGQVLDGYWRIHEPDAPLWREVEWKRPWPYIDALNTEKRCLPPNTDFVDVYLARARQCGSPNYPTGTYPEYRPGNAADGRRPETPTGAAVFDRRPVDGNGTAQPGLGARRAATHAADR